MSEVRDIMGAVVTNVPVLLARLMSSGMRLLFGSRRAAWSFRRTLQQKGMSRRRARQLAGQYRRQIDVVRIMRRFLRERPWQ